MGPAKNMKPKKKERNPEGKSRALKALERKSDKGRHIRLQKGRGKRTKSR